MGKSTKGHGGFAQKRTSTAVKSSDSSCPVWLFDKLDKNGEFAFDVNSPDFNHKDFLSKMIEYSLIPWAAIKKQTHDENKSKHHYLDYSSLSKEAQDRIKALDMESLTDAIFSFAFNNTLRIIGFRDGEYFHVVWYDRHHSFCPSKLKHT